MGKTFDRRLLFDAVSKKTEKKQENGARDWKGIAGGRRINKEKRQ